MSEYGFTLVPRERKWLRSSKVRAWLRECEDRIKASPEYAVHLAHANEHIMEMSVFAPYPPCPCGLCAEPLPNERNFDANGSPVEDA